VINALLHAALDLMPVFRGCDVRTGPSRPGFFGHDLHALGNHLPHPFLARRPRGDQIIAVAFAAVASELNIGIDI
jgi:hypothetical protein